MVLQKYKSIILILILKFSTRKAFFLSKFSKFTRVGINLFFFTSLLINSFSMTKPELSNNNIRKPCNVTTCNNNKYIFFIYNDVCSFVLEVLLNKCHFLMTQTIPNIS